MFKPDIFSDGEVSFFRSGLDVECQVKALLEREYPSCAANVEDVCQSGAIEINSNNYKFNSNGKTYILKKLSFLESAYQGRTQQAELVNRLVSEGIDIPEIFRSRKNLLLTEYEGKYWCLMPYREGRYYTGDNNEFEDTSCSIVLLFQKLKCINVTEYPAIARIEFFDEDFRKLAQSCLNNEAALINEFSDEIRERLSSLSKGISDTVDDLLIYHEGFDRRGVAHIDLHPHNLLIDSGKLESYLDFDSLLNTDSNTAFLFSVFKLARQAAVVKGLAEVKNSLKKVIEYAYELGVLNNISKNNIITLSKFEVIRRLVLILDLSINQGINDWNHVLPIQLESLNEIEELYSDF